MIWMSVFPPKCYVLTFWSLRWWQEVGLWGGEGKAFMISISALHKSGLREDQVRIRCGLDSQPSLHTAFASTMTLVPNLWLFCRDHLKRLIQGHMWMCYRHPIWSQPGAQSNELNVPPQIPALKSYLSGGGISTWHLRKVRGLLGGMTVLPKGFPERVFILSVKSEDGLLWWPSSDTWSWTCSWEKHIVAV